MQEAYVHGVSTRKVDELVKALGMTGISNSRVSELCEELDEEVERFRNRELEGPYPYVWDDAAYVKSARTISRDGSPRCGRKSPKQVDLPGVLPDGPSGEEIIPDGQPTSMISGK